MSNPIPATQVQVPLPSPEPLNQGIDLLRFCGWLAPTKDYSAHIFEFPGSNCHAPHGTTGRFWLTVNFYMEGQKFGSISSPEIDEKGYFNINFDDFLTHHPDANPDFIILDFFHSADVPGGFYLSHVHRQTGTYFATNISAVMGDTLFAHFHHYSLEKSAFWPNLLETDSLETLVVVMNPYDYVVSFQPLLFCPKGEQIQGEIFSVKPMRSQVMGVYDLFSNLDPKLVHNIPGNAICVSSQFRCYIYIMIRDRSSKLISSFDHPTYYSV